MFSHELQDFANYRKIDQKIHTTSRSQTPESVHSGQIQNVLFPRTVPEYKKRTHNDCFYHKFNKFIQPFVSDDHKISNPLQHILIRKAHCKRHHKQVFCKMCTFFSIRKLPGIRNINTISQLYFL